MDPNKILPNYTFNSSPNHVIINMPNSVMIEIQNKIQKKELEQKIYQNKNIVEKSYLFINNFINPISYS